MATIYRLTTLPYLQTWNTGDASLTINVLLMPTGDPRLSLTQGLPVPGPAIADSQIVLKVNLSKDAGELPTLTAVDAAMTIGLTMPTNRTAVFDQLDSIFHPSVPETPPVRTSDKTLRKYLTQSYRESFAFVQPRTGLAVIDDSYKCMLKCPPKKPLPKPTPPQYSWAEAIGYAMRQPMILRAAGLLHTLRVTLPSADFYKDGGWLYFTLDPSSDYSDAVALPGFFRTYATRIPQLSTAKARSVFTAVLFPVFADAADAAAHASAYDSVFPEAILFDDGFGKIVHAAQQQGMLHLDEDGSGPPPVQDSGILLGWDDEDVLIGQNRQIGLNPDGTEPADAPRGVVGYRLDVRKSGSANWTSLAQVHADSVLLGALDLGSFDGELKTEVHPRQLDDRIWLPAYFTSWVGGSMVVSSADDKALRGVLNPSISPYVSVGTDSVPLLYGNSYDFRVRMADGSGGGPLVSNDPNNDGEQPIAKRAFRRFVPPRKLIIKNQTNTPTGLTIELARPLIGYPDAVYAGIPNAFALLKAINDANVGGRIPIQEVGLPDKDVAYAQVRVLVRPPAFDPNMVDGWQEVYTTYRSFPASADATLTLTVNYVDVTQLGDFDVSGQVGPPGTVAGPLPLPTARDARIELSALCRNDLNYFANDRARSSSPFAVQLHAKSSTEPEFFRPLDPTQALKSVFLRLDSIANGAGPASIQAQNDQSPLVMQRLAQAAGLIASENSLLALPGQRVVFGCSGLKHKLSPENGSLTFTQLSELTNQWINVVRVELNRDWTWKGTKSPAFSFSRTLGFKPGGPTTTEDIGNIDLIHSVNSTAIADEPQRDRTVLIFVDAFTPPLWNKRPYELTVHYDFSASLESGDSPASSVETILPITTPPSQIPQVVAAGHALSDYLVDDRYTTTAARSRMLWLEFAEPLADPRDAYFVRILAHAPDPLLLARAEPVADPLAYDKSPIDPELARTIVPGQADDFAGLSVMQKMIPANGSDRHFLVPLPPGVTPASPELLGFYTYEIRVGHDRGSAASPFWSTAQGRFGPALLIEGVQHPAPQLSCGVTRLHGLIAASAPYAQPYYNGEDVLPAPPNTELWIALYAQVHQADDASMRNIQLDLRRAFLEQQARTFLHAQGRPRDMMAFTTWSDDEVSTLLARFGLAPDTPLSALAVELIPEPNSGFIDPLRGDLGEVRILRTSPLTPVQQVCC